MKNVSLRNRLISTAHEPAYTEGGLPKERYRLYHAEKARGGIGMTMIGGSSVVAPDSPQAFGNIELWRDESVRWLKELADDVHAHGAAVMIQITHLGRRTSWAAGEWLPILAPSSIREPAHRAYPKAMEDWDIERVIGAYADAAEKVAEAGLDGIELEAYGHLIDQFWSPLTNRRDDEHGGSLDNRMRFGGRVIAAVRERVGPDFALGVRMVCDEDLPGGIDREEGLSIAGRLAASGAIDFVNVIRGHIDTDEGLSRVIPGMGARSAPHLGFAGEVRGHARLPVMHAARIQDVATARHAIEGGLLGPRGHDARAPRRSAHRGEDRARGGGAHPPLRRRRLLHRLDLQRPGGVHPQRRHGPRGAASRTWPSPLRGAGGWSWWERGPGAWRPRASPASAGTTWWCWRRRTAPAARSASRERSGAGARSWA